MITLPQHPEANPVWERRLRSWECAQWNAAAYMPLGGISRLFLFCEGLGATIKVDSPLKALTSSVTWPWIATAVEWPPIMVSCNAGDIAEDSKNTLAAGWSVIESGGVELDTGRSAQPAGAWALRPACGMRWK